MKGVNTDFLQSVNRYYNRQKDAADGYDTDDIFKFSVRIDKEEEVSLLKSLGESSDSPFASVSSGFNYVDLIDEAVNQAVFEFSHRGKSQNRASVLRPALLTG